jgi:hypothetical protein
LANQGHLSIQDQRHKQHLFVRRNDDCTQIARWNHQALQTNPKNNCGQKTNRNGLTDKRVEAKKGVALVKYRAK